jgi:hypothetical protein
MQPGYAIEPIPIWVNGQVKTADFIICIIVLDNLLNKAVFQYQLCHQETEPDTGELMTFSFAQGNVAIANSEYDAWSATPDINYAAYEYVCNIMNLTLVP